MVNSVNQLPLLDRELEGGLADVAAFTESIDELVEDAQAELATFATNTKLSVVVQALNDLNAGLAVGGIYRFAINLAAMGVE